jgi:hypothetical protein
MVEWKSLDLTLHPFMGEIKKNTSNELETPYECPVNV